MYIAFDLWNTLAFSLPRDPIIDLINILKIKISIKEVQDKIQTRCFYSDNPIFEICQHLNINYIPETELYFTELLNNERLNFKLFPETLQVLKQVQKMGFKIILISNLWNFIIPTIDNQLLSLFEFDGVFLSCLLGFTKPNYLFFDYVKNDLGIISEKIIVVGDSLEKDILGGIKSQCHAIWLQRDISYNPKYVLNNFQQNKLFLGRITKLSDVLKILNQTY
ncbi:MAG: HAD family hydrolase [Nodularia sp. (in: Bacteria)]|nr:MAG: HAD family hydrolase [Nodularia sp. (in: cyanobacteria)]